MKKPVLAPASKLIKKTFRFAPRDALFAAMFLFIVMMGASLQDVWHEISKGRAPSVPQVMAEEKAAAPDKPEPDKPAEEKKPEAAPEAHKAPAGGAPSKPEGEAAKAENKDAAPAPEEKKDEMTNNPAVFDNYSEAEVNILKRLSERRQELEKRDRELDQREALIKLTEQRVDKKIADLKVMQDEIRKVIGDVNDKQKAQVASLVKIYEAMKPKEAARIFDNMDVPAVMDVVASMKEAKVAPILAAMDPGKAKQITAAILQKKPLPTPP